MCVQYAKKRVVRGCVQPVGTNSMHRVCWIGSVRVTAAARCAGGRGRFSVRFRELYGEIGK